MRRLLFPPDWGINDAYIVRFDMGRDEWTEITSPYLSWGIDWILPGPPGMPSLYFGGYVCNSDNTKNCFFMEINTDTNTVRCIGGRGVLLSFIFVMLGATNIY